MATPTTRKTLKEYCLRALGAPMLEINVTPDQCEDRIDEALQLYELHHNEGQVQTYLKHNLTTTDISNEYIPVPDTVIAVRRILPIRSERSSNASMFDIRYQLHQNDIFDLSYAGTLSHYVQTKQYIDLIQLALNGYDETVFSRHEDRIYLPSTDWGLFTTADWFVIDCWRTIDPETYTEVYNDYWLKRYVTALYKRQWGLNLIKFAGLQLPGSVTLDGQTIFNEGKEDVTMLEEELRNTWAQPLSFLIG